MGLGATRMGRMVETGRFVDPQHRLVARPGSLAAPQAAKMLDRLERVIEALDQSALIQQALNSGYSPNHAQGLTTAAHVRQQGWMQDALACAFVVASFLNGATAGQATIEELRALNFVQKGQFRSLHRMVDNPSFNPVLRVTLEDVIGYFSPLLEGLTLEDMMVLAAVIAYHDLGKTTVEQVKSIVGLNIEGVQFIAHEYASRAILERNPHLLSMFELIPDQEALALALIERHSAAGQYVFGEANLAVYQPILDVALTMGADAPLRLARIHGTIDVMSALGQGFVRPILLSHIRLGQMLSDVYARAGEGVTLESAFEEEAKSGITNLPTGLLHPVALYRLRKLTGLNDTPSDGNIMAEAIKGLDPSFVTEFDQATTGIAWSGTYVGNAFGFGIRKHYGKTPEAKDVIRIVQIMMKMVAAAYRYNQVVGCAPFSLSTVKPGLAVEAKKHQLILDEVAGFRDVDRALASLRGGSGRLYLAGRDNQVEVGYKEE